MEFNYLNETDHILYDSQILLESYDWSHRVISSYYDVFLSHSSEDKQSILPMVIEVLRREGAKVYIDNQDPSLPSRTSVETAKILRDRIEECNKFVVLVSQNSFCSRWIPWELGYADGKKVSNKIAVFPYVETNDQGEWVGQEYMGGYPLITRNNEGWIVYSRGQENPYTKLCCWLRQ